LTGEQVAARMTMIGQQFGDVLRVLPSKTLQSIVYVLIAIWLLSIIVHFVFLVIPSTTSEATAKTVPVVIGTASATVDISALQKLHLFGEAGAQSHLDTPVVMAEETVLDAEKTQLNLTLEGIVHTPDTSQSVAVIVYQGKQEQYYIGDKLPVGARVTLAKILVDHVILDNAGKYESLWLYDDEKIAQAQPIQAITPASRTAVTDKRDDDQATELAEDYRQRLYKNPNSLAEVLRISPAQKDGEMVGYRISPGRDRQQFTALGFKNNDIVTSINGIALDEPSKALEIYKLMRTATEATFTVDRNGGPVELMVSLGDQLTDP